MSPTPPRKPPSDDDPNIDKIKRDDEKPIEKVKAEKEKGEGKEIEKIKSDKEFEKVKNDKEQPEKIKPEKEHKLEAKEIEKVKNDKEQPEKIKPEKEHKLEAKEIEKVKNDKEFEKVKNDKEQPEKIKPEKEFKAEAKIEVREKQIPEKLDKEIAEVFQPGEEVVNPAAALDPAALLAHADSLEQTGRQLRHFIERSMRPDLSEGALSNEQDLQDDGPEPSDG